MQVTLAFPFPETVDLFRVLVLLQIDADYTNLLCDLFPYVPKVRSLARHCHLLRSEDIPLPTLMPSAVVR